MKKNKILLLIILLSITFTAFAIPTFKLAPLTYEIISSTTSVGTSATAIPATALVGRESIAIRLNSTSDTAYIGHSSVTTSNGFTLDSSMPSITIDVDDSVVIYAIVSTGTADIRTLEVK